MAHLTGQVKMKFIYVSILSYLFLSFGCSQPTGKIPLISSIEAEKVLANGGYLFLDVRTEQEHESGCIPNTPNIPIESLEARINELNQYKQKKIIVYCRSGNRSGRGTDLLIRHGFDAVNLTGGMNQWAGSVAIKK